MNGAPVRVITRAGGRGPVDDRINPVPRLVTEHRELVSDVSACARPRPRNVATLGEGPGGPSQQESLALIKDLLRGTPTLSVIPRDTRDGALTARHPGYDARTAQRDPGTVFPLAVLREMETEGGVRLAGNHYAFTGATSHVQLRPQVAPSGPSASPPRASTPSCWSRPSRSATSRSDSSRAPSRRQGSPRWRCSSAPSSTSPDGCGCRGCSSRRT